MAKITLQQAKDKIVNSEQEIDVVNIEVWQVYVPESCEYLNFETDDELIEYASKL